MKNVKASNQCKLLLMLWYTAEIIPITYFVFLRNSPQLFNQVISLPPFEN